MTDWRKLGAIAAIGGCSLANGQVAPFTEEAAARGLIYPVMNYPSATAYGYLGWGCGFADFDGDGDPDVIILGKSTGAVGIFENIGGTFVDRSASSGIPILPENSGFAVADYDGDGVLDINFTQLAAGNKLFRGVGNLAFTDVTATAGVGDTGAGKGCTWGDFDGDGWVDLFIANYDGIVPNTAGKTDRLYRNNGDGTFADVSVAQTVNSIGYGFSPAFTDIDNDGDCDLYLVQDRGHLPPFFQGNRLWRNDDGQMVEISEGSGADVHLFSMGLAVGDFDGNGFTDFYTTNIAASNPPIFGINPLLLNQGDNTFVESAVEWGVSEYITSWGCIFFDFDNNGWLDLYVNNQNVGNKLFANSGTPPCTDVSAQAAAGGTTGFSNFWSFCSAVADIDGDGDLDLLLNNTGGNVQLFINHEGEERRWVKYRVVGEGPNTAAIGATINSQVAGEWKLREVLSGANGYLGQNELTVHLGVDQALTVDEAIVRWPGGGPTRTLTNLPTNATWAIYPPSRLGDFNGDGSVDLVDLPALHVCYGGPLLPGYEMMDFDGNSVVDVDDAVLFAAGYQGPVEDCDNNGVTDLIQIIQNPGLDADGDGVLDDCGGDPADLNGDGTVDGADLGILLGNWGGKGIGDLDGNGMVDGADLGLLLAAWFG
ncbi:MAG: VCBS repeat-containing protein [Phycisphaerales bacterium]|nr:VCBS repeat-containing protein [Phycisphaerales bacterium]